MVTYAQLESEPYWGRERVPAPLLALGERLRRAHNRPAVAVGVKGDNAHLRGSHRSQEWILKSRYCTNRTYTVQSGLTAQQQMYLCGFDYNPGSEKLMIELCRRLDTAVRAGRLEIVREWYGNDDGDNRVDGYDNIRNQVASSDASHLWHIHLTIDRHQVNDEQAVRRIGDVLLGEEDDMPTEHEIANEVLHQHRFQRADGRGTINLANSTDWSRKHAADTKAAVATQVLPMLAAIQAAVSGEDLSAAVIASVRQALMDLVPVLANELGDAVSTEAVEAAMRRVLGSLDNQPEGSGA